MKTYDALIRVSKMNGRKESAETTMTLDDQEAAIDGAIAAAGGRRGLTLEALDQSGFTVHRSEAYRKILDRVRRGDSDGVAVAYGDRLTRNWRAVGAFYDALEDAGAEVLIAGMPGVDYRTAAGRMQTGMMAVMSDAQYMTAKARGEAIADLTVGRGVPNMVPFGYRRNADASGVKTDPDKDGKALVPDDRTAPIVKRIFRLRLDGHRIAAIVKILDDAGIPSPRGGMWTDSTVETILKNETYTGVVKLGRRRVEKAHKALASKADWRRAQGAHTVTHHGRYKAGLAGGLLECSGCGRPLSVAGRPGRITYSCRRKTTDGRCPRPVHVSKDAADDFVEKTMIDAIENRRLRLVVSGRELEAARGARDRAREQTKAFVEFADALDEGDFRDGYAARKAREGEAEAAYDRLVAEADDADGFPDSASAWEALDEDAKRRRARSVISGIVVSPPLSRSPRAPIADRFKIRWGREGQDAGTGR